MEINSAYSDNSTIGLTFERLFKVFAYPFHKFLLRPTIRYSRSVWIMQNIFKYVLSYSPREEMLNKTMEYVSACFIPGDYLEFGVYQGDGFSAAYNFSKRRNLNSMNFYAFDSFQGLPEIKGADDRRGQGPNQFQRGEYACDQQTFVKNISRKGVDLERTEIVPGWFNDVLSTKTKQKLKIENAALIWIDCDLYESTVPVLEFITDYVQDGTVIVFDDWFYNRGNPNMGEQRAFTEWLEKNPSIKATEFRKYDWQGNSFILHKN